jgi:signal transduction histidine kinase
MNIVHTLLVFSWFLLFTLALFFLALEIRCKFDRVFLYLGGALLLLCGFTSVDLWALPSGSPSRDLLFYRLQHLGFVLFCLLTLVCILDVVQRPKQIIMQTMGFASVLLSLLSFTPWVLGVQDGSFAVGSLYMPLYGAYFAVMLTMFVGFCVAGLRKNITQSDKRILITHLVGLSILALFGIADMVCTIFPSLKIVSSMTQIGTTFYGLAISSIFIEKFVQVLRDRSTTFSKLELAYNELEAANALKQIGESTAIVNHEIKNYMFMISGSAQILKELEPLTQKGNELVDNIIVGVDRMNQFCKSILDMSKEQVTLDKHPIQISRLIHEVIQNHFQESAAFINVLSEENEKTVMADWGRMEQVFINLIRNALEAMRPNTLPEIQIEVFSDSSVVLVNLEDNGIGCSSQQINQLFKAFYTTKKVKGGTGLGLSIVKSIVESHGGKISAYSKREFFADDTGMKFSLSFPNFSESDAKDRRPMPEVVILGNGQSIDGSILRTLRNVCLSPIVLDSVEELERSLVGSDSFIMVPAQTAAQESKKLRRFKHLFLVSQRGNATFLFENGEGREPEPISEEYIFTHMICKKKMKAPVQRDHWTSVRNSITVAN